MEEVYKAAYAKTEQKEQEEETEDEFEKLIRDGGYPSNVEPIRKPDDEVDSIELQKMLTWEGEGLERYAQCDRVWPITEMDSRLATALQRLQVHKEANKMKEKEINILKGENERQAHQLHQ